MANGLAPIRRLEADGEFAFAGDHEIRCTVLVAERVTADHDGPRPARHQPWHICDDDRLAEDGSVENVADGAVGRTPHFLEAELLYPRLVGGDGRAFDADAILLDRLGRFDGNAVLSRVATLDAKIVIAQPDVEIGQDQPFLDEPPDDAGHLVAV